MMPLVAFCGVGFGGAKNKWAAIPFGAAATAAAIPFQVATAMPFRATSAAASAIPFEVVAPVAIPFGAAAVVKISFWMVETVVAVSVCKSRSSDGVTSIRSYGSGGDDFIWGVSNGGGGGNTILAANVVAAIPFWQPTWWQKHPTNPVAFADTAATCLGGSQSSFGYAISLVNYQEPLFSDTFHKLSGSATCLLLVGSKIHLRQGRQMRWILKFALPKS